MNTSWKIARAIKLQLTFDLVTNLPEGFNVWRRFNLPILDKVYYITAELTLSINKWYFHKSWSLKAAIELY